MENNSDKKIDKKIDTDKKKVGKSKNGFKNSLEKRNKKNSLNRYKKPLEVKTNTVSCGCEICTNENKHGEFANYSKQQELFIILYSILKKRFSNESIDLQDVKLQYIGNAEYKPFVENHPMLQHRLKYKMAEQILCSSPYFKNSQREGLTQYGHKFSLVGDIDSINPWAPLSEQQKHSYVSKKIQKGINIENNKSKKDKSIEIKSE